MHAKNWICSAAVAMAVVFGGRLPAQAAITMISAPPPAALPDRYVFAVATDATTGATGPPSATSSAAFGSFAPAPASVSSVGPFGSISATATQTSTTPSVVGTSINGGGTATASVAWDGFGPPVGGYSLTADSFFDVFFEVDVPGTYNLSGVVDSGGTFPGGHGSDSAEVRLMDADAPATIFVEETNPGDPGPDAFNVNLSLSPGITYHLTARALVSHGFAVDTASAAASWSFDLDAEAVPEPSTFALAVLGLAGLGLIAWRKKFRRA